MIKDYSALISRGSLYVKRSGLIWARRKDKLFNKCSYVQTIDQLIRLKKLIYCLEARLYRLGEILDAHEYRRQQQIFADSRFMVLNECANPTCRNSLRAERIAIPFSSFVPDRATCRICGAPLRIVDQGEIDGLFDELNSKNY